MAKREMLITMDQYRSLNPIGKEIHDYWMKWKPKMYRELNEMGRLWAVLSSENNRLNEMMIELVVEQRLAEDQAREIIRAEIYE